MLREGGLALTIDPLTDWVMECEVVLLVLGVREPVFGGVCVLVSVH